MQKMASMPRQFNHEPRANIHHVRHDKRITFRRRTTVPWCISTIWARSTRSRKVHLFAIPPLTVRAIYLPRLSRTWTSETFLPLKQRIPRSHAWNVAEWVATRPFLFLSNRIERARLAFPSPRLRFSLVRPSKVSARFEGLTTLGAYAIHRNASSSSGGTSLGPEFQRIENTSVPHEENRVIPPCSSVPRNGRLSRAFRYREVRKGCEETGLSLPRTPVTFATFDIISSSTRSRNSGRLSR